MHLTLSFIFLFLSSFLFFCISPLVFFCLSLLPSISLNVNPLSVFLSFCLSVFLSFCLSVFVMTVFISIWLSSSLLFCLCPLYDLHQKQKHVSKNTFLLPRHDEVEIFWSSNYFEFQFFKSTSVDSTSN